MDILDKGSKKNEAARRKKKWKTTEEVSERGSAECLCDRRGCKGQYYMEEDDSRWRPLN